MSKNFIPNTQAQHLAQLLSFHSHLARQLQKVEEEIAELRAFQHAETSPVRRDEVAHALLEQRMNARRRPENELLGVMLEDILIDWRADEFGSGDDLP